MRTSILKITERYLLLINCSDIYERKRNIGNTSKNIKCGNLKKN